MFVSKAAAEDCGGFIWPIRLTLKNEEFFMAEIRERSRVALNCLPSLTRKQPSMPRRLTAVTLNK
jgi:hypothetical protein